MNIIICKYPHICLCFILIFALCFNVVSTSHAFIFYPVLFYCTVTLGDLKAPPNEM